MWGPGEPTGGRKLVSPSEGCDVKGEPPVEETVQAPVIPASEAVRTGRAAVAVRRDLERVGAKLVTDGVQYRLDVGRASEFGGIACSVLVSIGEEHACRTKISGSRLLESTLQFFGVDLQVYLAATPEDLSKGPESTLPSRGVRRAGADRSTYQVQPVEVQNEYVGWPDVRDCR